MKKGQPPDLSGLPLTSKNANLPLHDSYYLLKSAVKQFAQLILREHEAVIVEDVPDVVVATLLVGGQKLLFDLPFVLYLHGLFFAPGGGLVKLPTAKYRLQMRLLFFLPPGGLCFCFQ